MKVCQNLEEEERSLQRQQRMIDDEIGMELRNIEEDEKADKDRSVEIRGEIGELEQLIEVEGQE